MTLSPSFSTLPVPSRAMAAALATIGYTVTAKAYRNDDTGKMSVRWSCGGWTKQAQAFLDRVNTRDPKHSLRRKSPEHPYLVCLYYLEALESLQAWRQDGVAPSVLPADRGVRIMRAMRGLPPGTLNLLRGAVPSGFQPSVRIASPHLAAVAVILGFVLSPHLTPEGAWECSAASATFQSLTIQEIAAITSPSTHVLGTCAPGEHPACYALQCAANLATLLREEDRVLRSPVHMMRGHGTRTAMMNEAMLTAKDSRYRDRLRLHLAGLT